LPDRGVVITDGLRLHERSFCDKIFQSGRSWFSYLRKQLRPARRKQRCGPVRKSFMMLVWSRDCRAVDFIMRMLFIFILHGSLAGG